MAGVPTAPGDGTPSELLIRLMMPALAAPEGADKTMTTEGPEQIWYLVTSITCVAIPGLFLIARVYTKLGIVRTVELADYLIMLAYPLIVIEVVIGYYMVKWGSGVHQWQITLGQLFNQLYWANAGEVIYSPAIFLVKMAILTQYLRLFAPSRSLNRIMWYGAWATIISSFIFYVIQMFWTLLYCKPRRMIWDKLTPGGKCQDHTPIVFSQGMFSIVSDVVILLLPTSSLWKLRVPMARKVVITILFATGLLAIAAAGMRIFFTAKIKPVISKADVSYYGLFIGLWTEAEIALGFIVACALSVPRLIQAKRNNLNRAVSYVVTPIRSATGTLHSRSRSWSHSRNRSSSKGSKSSNSRTSQRNIEDGVEPKILHGVMDSKAPEMSVADIGAISSESSSIYSKGESLNILPEIKQLERIDEEMLIMRNFDFDFESGRH